MVEIIVIVIILGFIVLLSLNLYFKFILPFNEEKKYIKMEMIRSFDDYEEYRYWNEELKRLYLSLIPIYRWFMFRK